MTLWVALRDANSLYRAVRGIMGRGFNQFLDTLHIQASDQLHTTVEEHKFVPSLPCCADWVKWPPLISMLLLFSNIARSRMKVWGRGLNRPVLLLSDIASVPLIVAVMLPLSSPEALFDSLISCASKNQISSIWRNVSSYHRYPVESAGCYCYIQTSYLSLNSRTYGPEWKFEIED